MTEDFKRKFPNVAAVNVALTIRRGGPLDERPEFRSYSAENISMEPVRCTNPRCQGGGWYLWDAVADVITKKEANAKRGGVCKGSERMNRQNSRDCLALFQADITVVYK